MVQHANQAGTSQVKAVDHEHAIDSKIVDIASLEAHHSCTDAPNMSSSEVSVSAAYIEPESGRTLKVLTDGTLVITPGSSKPPTFGGSEIVIPSFVAPVAAPPSQALPAAPTSAAAGRPPEKSASAPSSPPQPQPLPNDVRSQRIPEHIAGEALARAGSATAAPPPHSAAGQAPVTIKAEEMQPRVPSAAGQGEQACSEATEQGGSLSGVDAAEKANSELLLNFAHSAATEQPHTVSAPPAMVANSAVAEPAAAPPVAAATADPAGSLSNADAAAAAQRRAAADMLVRSLLDTIAQRSPGSALPGEAAVMQSLLQLANKCMDRHLAPTEAELRAALERCLQRVRTATSASGLTAAAPSRAAAQAPKGVGKGGTLPALAFTAPPTTGPQATSIHSSSTAWNSTALPAALVNLQAAVGSKRPAEAFPAAAPKTLRPALPAVGSQVQTNHAAADAPSTPPMSQREADTMQLLRSLHNNPNIAIKILQKAMDRQAPGPAPVPTSPPPPLQPVPPSPSPAPESPSTTRRALLQLLQQNPQLLTMLEQNPGNESARAMLNALLTAAMPPPAAPPPPPDLPVVLRDMQQAGAGDPAIMHVIQTLMQQRLLQSQMPSHSLAPPATSFFAPSSAAPNSTSMPLHTIPMSLLKAAAAAKNPTTASAPAPVDASSFGAFPRDGRRLSAADEGAMAALARLQQMQPPPSPQLTADLLQRAGMLRLPATSQAVPSTSAQGFDAATLERLGQHAQHPASAAQIVAARPHQQDTSHSQLLQLLETVARTGARPLRRQSSGQPNGATST